MRRAPVTLLAAGVALAALCAPPAAAQNQAVAAMTLAEQTPWNSPRHPDLKLQVYVTNTGTSTLEGLAIQVTIFEPLQDRSQYEPSLSQDVGAPLHTWSTVSVQTVPPAKKAAVGFSSHVAFLQRAFSAPHIYPLKVELLNQSGSILATLRTPLIFLPKNPQLPVDLAWTFVLGHPIAYGPDGVFVDRELERRLGEGGSLSGEIEALTAMATGPDASPVDVVVSPTLLLNLNEMRDGYRVQTGQGSEQVPPEQGGAAAAEAALASLKELAAQRTVETSAMPYGVPDIPQLIRSGLGGDLSEQLDLGLQTVDAALRAFPDQAVAKPSMMRPPGSSIDGGTLARLRANLISILLLDEGVVVQPQQSKGFAAPGTATLPAGPSATLTAIVPDDALQTLLASPTVHDDARLGAHVVLGDLAAIWLERPRTSRAVAMIVSGEQDLPPDFFDALTHEIATAPWLRTMKATQVAAHHPPVQEPANYKAFRSGPFPDEYPEALRDSATLIDHYMSTIIDPAEGRESAASLRSRLLLAEGSALVERERLGLAWLASIGDDVNRQFAAVGADSSQVVTLTSSGGRLPVRVTNRADHAVRVGVALVSARLTFPSGSTRQVSLAPGETRVLVFDASARTTGTFPVRVTIQTPTGATMTESTITVRSTAYNRVALLITLGAILVLLAIWARRLLSPKKA